MANTHLHEINMWMGGRKWLSTQVKLISKPSRGICSTAIKESSAAFHYAFSTNVPSLYLVREHLETVRAKEEITLPSRHMLREFCTLK